MWDVEGFDVGVGEDRFGGGKDRTVNGRLAADERRCGELCDYNKFGW